MSHAAAYAQATAGQGDAPVKKASHFTGQAQRAEKERVWFVRSKKLGGLPEAGKLAEDQAKSAGGARNGFCCFSVPGVVSELTERTKRDMFEELKLKDTRVR